MAKITANQYVKVAWVLDANMTTTQAAAPTDTILNAGTTVQLTNSVAWTNFAIAAAASADVTDRGIADAGNAVTRGLSNYAATLEFFRDANPTDSTSDYVTAFATFRTPRTYGYLVVRVAEQPGSVAWTKGDRVSVYRFVADIVTDTVAGDVAPKFSVEFLQQGVMFPYTIVKGATPDAITGVPTTLAKTVAGGPFTLLPVLSGKDIRSDSLYVSSDTTKVRVTQNGVVIPVATGSPTITVTHPAATAPIVCTLTLT
jgi:hypothetical protein